MLSKQIFKKHWINNFFLLIGFFLLISFFLPFTAEGVSFLAIDGCVCSGAGKTVSFRVSLKGSFCRELGIFSFDVIYDPDILEYRFESSGVGVDSLYVKNHGNYLEVEGTGNDTEICCYHNGGREGTIAFLNFKVKKCEETTVVLNDLHGDFFQMRTLNNGHLSVIEDKNESSVYAPPDFGSPWPALNTIGFPQSLFPGYVQPAFSGFPYLTNPVSYPYPDYSGIGYYSGGLYGGYYGIKKGDRFILQ